MTNLAPVVPYITVADLKKMYRVSVLGFSISTKGVFDKLSLRDPI